ncbi:DNA translocase FtsK, partial [Microvirga sp. KLBC 81]|uniref:DNA translocase FtsK n=1 Tax=Microvirga sp. KLBC 81 TaxID=1862707 RepID=UPI002739FB49
MISEGEPQRFQNASWVAPVTATFAWQASPVSVRPFMLGDTFAPIMSNTMTDNETDTGPVMEAVGSIEDIEDAEFFEPQEFSPEAENEPATGVDIKEADLDLGYLALYADELRLVAKPDTKPASAVGEVLSAPAPVDAEEVRPRAAIATEGAQTPDLIVSVPAPEDDQNGDMGLPSCIDNSIEASITDTEVLSNSSDSDLSRIIETDTTEIDDEAHPETPNELGVAHNSESEARLPSAEIIVLPRPVAHREIIPAYELPLVDYLAEAPEREGEILTEDILEEAAGRLEKVIRDFGVRGEVIHVHPGPVVTLYEFEPAPGIKSSRVIALTEDIARSMSAVSARVAVIPGRNANGVELPNEARETVYLREILESEAFTGSTQKMPLCLGKTIGGEPVIADLARMPHLLVAG